MEFLNGPELREIKTICQETIKTFSAIFLACAQDAILRGSLNSYQHQLAQSLKPVDRSIPKRPNRNILPARSPATIPPHIPEHCHTYDQDVNAKLSCTIVGWREVNALSHYGVYVIEVVCSDGRPPKWVYKRFREFERLYNSYKTLLTAAKVKMPTTSSSSNLVSHQPTTTLAPSMKNRNSSFPGAPNSKGNKFDPAFHSQRASELQPMLTALCNRSDVFGLTKFMKWLFFEKKQDTELLGFFQKAFQKTLDIYKLTQPVYSNNMVDALTWLLFFRVSHIWEKIKKGAIGTHYFAARSVQETILKCIKPLDDMIQCLNDRASLIFTTLKQNSNLLLRPISAMDSAIAEVYTSVISSYEAPIQSCVFEIAETLSKPCITLGESLRSKIAEMFSHIQYNVEREADEASITALVTSIEDLFHNLQSEAVPAAEQAFMKLHHNLCSKFTSPALIASFSAIGDIVPILGRFLDAIISPRTLLDIFIRILKVRNAVEALENTLDAAALTLTLNELETEFEREIEKIEIDLRLRARSFHSDLRRFHSSCFAIATPIGNSMLKFAKMWGKYLRTISRKIGNLFAVQLVATVHINWSISVRECILLGISKSNDYLFRKGPKIVSELIHDVLAALFEPLIVAIISQVSAPAVLSVQRLLGTQSIPSGEGSSTLLSDIIEPNEYVKTATRRLFGNTITASMESHFFAHLSNTWAKTQLVYSKATADIVKQRHMTLSLLDQKLLAEAGMSHQTLPPSSPRNNVPANAISTSSNNGNSVSSPTISRQPFASFSEAPVARVLEGSNFAKEDEPQTDAQAQPSGLEKKIRQSLALLAEFSNGEDPSKTCEATEEGFEGVDLSGADAPLMSLDFDVFTFVPTEQSLNPKSILEQASATRAQYRYSTRVYYEVPDEAFPNPSNQIQNVPAHTIASEGSDGIRVVPRKPTLTGRGPRQSALLVQLPTGTAPAGPTSPTSPTSPRSPPITKPIEPSSSTTLHEVGSSPPAVRSSVTLPPKPKFNR